MQYGGSAGTMTMSLCPNLSCGFPWEARGQRGSAGRRQRSEAGGQQQRTAVASQPAAGAGALAVFITITDMCVSISNCYTVSMYTATLRSAAASPSLGGASKGTR